LAWFKLLESLTGKRLKGYHPQPTQLMMKLDNLQLFLRTLAFFGIALSGVSPEGSFPLYFFFFPSRRLIKSIRLDLFSGNDNISLAIALSLIKQYGGEQQRTQISAPPQQAEFLRLNLPQLTSLKTKSTPLKALTVDQVNPLEPTKKKSTQLHQQTPLLEFRHKWTTALKPPHNNPRPRAGRCFL